jgi:hypothetical protein
MASVLYPSFKKLLLDGDIDLLTDTIKCVLIDTADYTYSASHDNLDDVAAAARVGTAQTLANKTTTGGVFDADDIVFSAVTGDPTEAVIVYKEGGTEATSPLIAYIEGSVTPNGGDITIQWDSGANKIFAL